MGYREDTFHCGMIPYVIIQYNTIRLYLIQYDLMQYDSLFNADIYFNVDIQSIKAPLLKPPKDISQKTGEFCFYDTCREKEDKMSDER